jgi:hypothetical protein
LLHVFLVDPTFHILQSKKPYKRHGTPTVVAQEFRTGVFSLLLSLLFFAGFSPYVFSIVYIAPLKLLYRKLGISFAFSKTITHNTFAYLREEITKPLICNMNT